MRSLSREGLNRPSFALAAFVWATVTFAQPAPLIEAVRLGDNTRIQNELDRSPDIARSNEKGRTLLHEAAIYNRAAIAKLLIERGADINAKDNLHIIEGTTPLHFAANANSADVANVLLAAGADVGARNRIGDTPLHAAAFEGSTAVAELLIRRGADVNSTGNNGLTPLHWAAYRSKPQVALLLLKSGANVGIKDRQGRTTLDAAAEGGSSEVAQSLLQHGADPCWLRGKRVLPFDAENAGTVIKMVVAKCGASR